MFAERVLILHTDQPLAWMTVTVVPGIKMILQNHHTPLLSGMYKLCPLKLALKFLLGHLVTPSMIIHGQYFIKTANFDRGLTRERVVAGWLRQRTSDYS